MINNLGDRIKYNPRNKSDDHLNRYTMILTLIYILNFFDTLSDNEEYKNVFLPNYMFKHYILDYNNTFNTDEDNQFNLLTSIYDLLY